MTRQKQAQFAADAVLKALGHNVLARTTLVGVLGTTLARARVVEALYGCLEGRDDESSLVTPDDLLRMRREAMDLAGLPQYEEG